MHRQLIVPLVVAALAVPVAAAVRSQASPAAHALARSPELSTSTRLADRRSYVIGTRFYEVGAEDGSYPATGFHTRGEMGGFWSMPIKLLDGVWFRANGRWLTGSSFTQGWGYTRTDLGRSGAVRISRTDVVPDGVRAGLIGLTLRAGKATHLDLAVDAHSELMSAYPWGESTPSQSGFNLRDTASVQGNHLVFRDRGTSPGATSAHDYSAVVGSTLTPRSSALGPDHRGPQDPAVVCPASGAGTPDPPKRCDDTAYGKGTGGQLRYRVDVPAGARTIWFSVAGSDRSLADAQRQQASALDQPAAQLRAKVVQRLRYERQTRVSLPGDPRLAESIRWSKQNLLDSRQQARNLQLRVTNAGTKYPSASGTLGTADWIGSGWPDYPWIFGTDGEYTAFAAVAAGQFASIENHLRTLRRISDKVNARSGKVVHEVVPDGSVYFGANSDDGNTDETVKFPSAVALVWRWTGDNQFRDDMYDFAVRNMRYATSTLDADHDGWPEGAGNVEREGMGAEKLDNAVYTIRGLGDLADLAASKHDTSTQRWARAKAAGLLRRFEKAWWAGDSTRSYADSLTNPTNARLFQRYWIGLTPVEAELPAAAGAPARPVARLGHARTTVAQHELPCFTGTNGLYHTGTGATSDAKGNPGPTCDATTSSAPSDREVFTLTTSVAAVAEAALGRFAPGQAPAYTADIARVQMDPSVWEVPGMMPEIAPSPDFVANIDQPFYTRSSGLQAWGTYGVLWPVVHFELGIEPDLGRGRVSVVPQIPSAQHEVAGRDVRLGDGSVDVSAKRGGHTLTTIVTRHRMHAAMHIGALLPAGTSPTSVRLDGHRVHANTVPTARGVEILTPAGRSARTVLVVRYR